MSNFGFFSEELLSELGIIDWSYTQESSSLSFNHFENWVQKNHHGTLTYLSDHRKDLRQDLKKIFPEFKSGFVFLFDYSAEKKRSQTETYPQKLASYALGFDGEDYHHVFKKRLEKLKNALPKQENLKTFVSIDAQPVLERDLAYRSGLGWFGKNSMLISRAHGSYFLIAGLFTNQEYDLKTSEIETDHCGSCTKCIDLCPTDAINPDSRTLIAERCISTFTIEHFKPTTPPENINKANGEIFGCDICQDVCPWNEKKLKTTAPNHLSDQANSINQFFITRDLGQVIEDLEGMSNRAFRKKFQGTVFERTGRVGVLKNLMVLKENNP